MSLSAGEQIGPYRILGPLGQGGMGEVYRARDPRLERDVALKVIREEGAGSADSLSRFQRETRAVAALHHPGILAIYDTGLHGGAPYAVMELLAGETLAERLQAGALPARAASEIAARVADALADAHAHGVIHRDVKPSNIFLTEDGQTKVLDFGIARVIPPGGEGVTSDFTAGQTAGGLVGTAGYVSPEQVRGRPADARSDVFSLGGVLYEAITGRKAFSGATAAEALSAVLSQDPADYPETGRVPAELRRITLRCLEKDPANRYQSARDLALDLRAWETGALAGAAAAPLRPSRRLLRWVVGALAATLLVAAGLLVGSRAGRRFAPAAPVTRVELALDPPLAGASAERPLFAISRDGTRLAYVAFVESRTRLALRELDGLETRILSGTEDATGPFFSPDGRWVGFFAGGALKKISLLGGSPARVGGGVPPVTRGASWGPDETIVFSPANTTGLVRRSTSTGGEKRVAWPDYDRGETAFWWPEILPEANAVLFVVNRGDETFETASISALRLDGGQKKILVRGGTGPHYAPTGHLLYVRGGTILAAPFDATRLEVTGPAVPLLSGVRTEGTGAAQLALSANGTLVYLPGPSPNQAPYRLVRVERSGRAKPFAFAAGGYYGPRFSPNGKRLAFAKGAANQDVWVADLERGTVTRLTPEASEEFDPVWSPDGRRIAYSSERRALEPQILIRAGDGGGDEELLLKRETATCPQAWSADGKVLVFSEIAPETRWDIGSVEVGRGAEARSFLATPYDEAQPDFSPDGHWIAYTSNDSGRFEIYARPFPGPGGRVQISTEGGMEPVWSRDGNELFYRDGDRMMSVPARLGGELRVGQPTVLFEKPGLFALPFLEFRQYDVAPDGKSFVMIQLPDAQAPASVPILVTNWFSELERKVSAR
ncbi:MAG: protein kinase [Thermoanaerobaculia bacterium]